MKKTVNIIGGFLGSGKTTLVNYILSHMIDKKVDVLVREYGAVSIDDMLINLKKENIHVFTNLHIHEDPQILLYHYFQKLHDKTIENPFDHLLMEASGLDTPEGLIHLFFLGHMQHLYKLGSYIVIVDAEYGQLNLDEYKVAKHQVAFADVILLNKVDLVNDEEIDVLEKRIHNINSMAKIYRTQYGRVKLDNIMNIDLYKQLKDLSNICKEEKNSVDNIKTVVLSENRPMDKKKVNDWIQDLFTAYGNKLLRSKGFFYFKNDDYRYEFQAVRKTYHSKADKKWEDSEERKSVVVLIAEDEIDSAMIQKSFSSCC
ncbi:MAG: GTP-binding protein [Tissierellia bacterium]|jgi:G3E family GTPase|nr:GTP-binding protein [Tissierellia bacterium]MDD3226354.1 GTP-binding protein [Tissierellia bacterium]MDD3750450.1 GTP-binding protein [Tissierellia bacterium]MDD4045567.1 GTP-binding protein [Tissierellia bacterium]MDD4678192.1 GTP-binding protein [Tissierellia bacterium]